MNKSKKTTLAIFFGILVLMSFHPIGRMIVKWILPLGVGIIDLIGTAFLVIFLLTVIRPKGWKKWIKKLFNKKDRNETSVENMQYTGNVDDVMIQNFVFELAKRDKKNEFMASFMKVIDVAVKRNKLSLVTNFNNYYGQLTLKLLDTKEDLSTHQESVEINETRRNIEQALTDIRQICNKFIAKLIDDDLIDINADIKVLGIVSNYNNLK